MFIQINQLFFNITGKHLGKGTFGQVKLGQHTLTGEKVAIKILEKDKINDQKDVERITREIKILKKLRFRRGQIKGSWSPGLSNNSF